MEHHSRGVSAMLASSRTDEDMGGAAHAEGRDSSHRSTSARRQPTARDPSPPNLTGSGKSPDLMRLQSDVRLSPTILTTAGMRRIAGRESTIGPTLAILKSQINTPTALIRIMRRSDDCRRGTTLRWFHDLRGPRKQRNHIVVKMHVQHSAARTQFLEPDTTDFPISHRSSDELCEDRHDFLAQPLLQHGPRFLRRQPCAARGCVF